MLDKATLTLGDNRRVDLSQTVIYMTSNLAGERLHGVDDRRDGIYPAKDKPATDLDIKVERTAVEAARRKFSPEFMNRLDKVVVFHPLQRTQLKSAGDRAGQCSSECSKRRGAVLVSRDECGADFLLLRERTSDTERDT